MGGAALAPPTPQPASTEVGAAWRTWAREEPAPRQVKGVPPGGSPGAHLPLCTYYSGLVATAYSWATWPQHLGPVEVASLIFSFLYGMPKA